VVEPGLTDDRARRDQGTSGRRDCGEVGIRGAHPAPVVDRDCELVDDPAGKGHQPRPGRVHLRSERDVEVDTPMAGIVTPRSKRLDHRSHHRHGQRSATAVGDHPDGNERYDRERNHGATPAAPRRRR